MEDLLDFQTRVNILIDKVNEIESSLLPLEQDENNLINTRKYIDTKDIKDLYNITFSSSQDEVLQDTYCNSYIRTSAQETSSGIKTLFVDLIGNKYEEEISTQTSKRVPEREEFSDIFLSTAVTETNTNTFVQLDRHGYLSNRGIYVGDILKSEGQVTNVKELTTPLKSRYYNTEAPIDLYNAEYETSILFDKRFYLESLNPNTLSHRTAPLIYHSGTSIAYYNNTICANNVSYFSGQNYSQYNQTITYNYSLGTPTSTTLTFAGNSINESCVKGVPNIVDYYEIEYKYSDNPSYRPEWWSSEDENYIISTLPNSQIYPLTTNTSNGTITAPTIDSQTHPAWTLFSSSAITNPNRHPVWQALNTGLTSTISWTPQNKLRQVNSIKMYQARWTDGNTYDDRNQTTSIYVNNNLIATYTASDFNDNNNRELVFVLPETTDIEQIRFVVTVSRLAAGYDVPQFYDINNNLITSQTTSTQDQIDKAAWSYFGSPETTSNYITKDELKQQYQSTNPDYQNIINILPITTNDLAKDNTLFTMTSHEAPGVNQNTFENIFEGKEYVNIYNVQANNNPYAYTNNGTTGWNNTLTFKEPIYTGGIAFFLDPNINHGSIRFIIRADNNVVADYTQQIDAINNLPKYPRRLQDNDPTLLDSAPLVKIQFNSLVTVNDTLNITVSASGMNQPFEGVAFSELIFLDGNWEPITLPCIYTTEPNTETYYSIQYTGDYLYTEFNNVHNKSSSLKTHHRVVSGIGAGGFESIGFQTEWQHEVPPYKHGLQEIPKELKNVKRTTGEITWKYRRTDVIDNYEQDISTFNIDQDKEGFATRLALTGFDYLKRYGWEELVEINDNKIKDLFKNNALNLFETDNKYLTDLNINYENYRIALADSYKPSISNPIKEPSKNYFVSTLPFTSTSSIGRITSTLNTDAQLWNIYDFNEYKTKEEFNNSLLSFDTILNNIEHVIPTELQNFRGLRLWFREDQTIKGIHGTFTGNNYLKASFNYDELSGEIYSKTNPQSYADLSLLLNNEGLILDEQLYNQNIETDEPMYGYIDILIDAPISLQQFKLTGVVNNLGVTLTQIQFFIGKYGLTPIPMWSLVQ